MGGGAPPASDDAAAGTSGRDDKVKSCPFLCSFRFRGTESISSCSRRVEWRSKWRKRAKKKSQWSIPSRTHFSIALFFLSKKKKKKLDLINPHLPVLQRPAPARGRHPRRLPVARRHLLHRPRHRAPAHSRRGQRPGGRRRGDAAGLPGPVQAQRQGRGRRRRRGLGRGRCRRGQRPVRPEAQARRVGVLRALLEVQPQDGRVGEFGATRPLDGRHGRRRGRRPRRQEEEARRRRGGSRRARRGARRVRPSRAAGARGVHQGQERGADRAREVGDGDVVL